MTNSLPHFVRNCMIRCYLKHGPSKDFSMPLHLNRRYSSSLYISGRKAHKTFAFVTPYLDFDKQLSNLEKLNTNLSSRGLKINTSYIKSMWEFYKSMNINRSKLELRSNTLRSQLSELCAKKDLDITEKLKLNKLSYEYEILKQDLKAIKEVVWDVSESIVEKMLKLPNEIHHETPLQFPTVLNSSGTLPKVSDTRHMKNHIEIGRSLGLLEYKDPMQYYLCNDAALFEHSVLNYVGKIFSEEDIIRVIGSDFSRSFVVEGCGLNHEDPFGAFVINNHSDVEKDTVNRMHLVGGASLIAFLAMHTKQLINPNHFPIKYFCTGRQYKPFSSSSMPIGLFTVCQSSVAHVFVLVKDEISPDYEDQFSTLLRIVTQLYEDICDHYQVVARSASELRPWETMRVSFELWSPFLGQYIEVGHISMCGDYLSKRLLIGYQTVTGRNFPCVISGTVLSVPRLLGCLLEQNPEKFVIPPKIVEHMPVDYTLI